MKNREQLVSLVGVVFLALVLPGILRLTNSTVKLLVGAEGRLAAIAVETNHPLGVLPRPWQALAQGGENIGTFLDGLTERVQNLKTEYIRIDHIYDQYDLVANENGRLTFNWQKLDETVNKIRQTGAKPMFSLSYMPPAISSGDILSEPRNWLDWQTVVQKTIEHYSGTLGMEGIYYEVWNEPDLFGKWTMGGKKDYKNLYLYASRGAAAASGVRPFKLGGPATTGLYRNWMDNFFPFVLQNNLRLDFFSWHRYGLNLDKYQQDVTDVTTWIDKHPYFANVEMIISEMGANSEMGGENDTHIGAAYTIASMRELTAKIKYGYTFAISGNWGIFGKPREKALEMLAKLGNLRMGVSGEGTWVRAIGAMDKNKYQLLVVNYDPKQIHSESVPVSFINLPYGKETVYKLRTTYLQGDTTEESISTTSAILQKQVLLTANSAALVELEPQIASPSGGRE